MTLNTFTTWLIIAILSLALIENKIADKENQIDILQKIDGQQVIDLMIRETIGNMLELEELK